LSLHINLLYRKKTSGFFSIEKVFGLVSNAIQHSINKSIKLEKIELPFRSSNVFLLFFNLLFILTKRKGLFHITGDIHYINFVLPRNRTVLTIHDLVFLNTHKGFVRWFLKMTYLMLPVRRAKYITTISEKSKNEIIRFTGCSPNKIIVIPNPVDSKLVCPKKNFNSIKPVLLYLGTKPNKNIEISILSLYGLNVHLRIIGELTTLQKEVLGKYKIDYSNGIELSDSQIHTEFSNCDIVFFPSTYEGFGLPVIEGFKAGRPVITSNLEPMKEISHGAALLVNPFSVASIREAVIKLVNNEQLRDELVERGFDVVKQYEVETIAQQYIKLWSKIDEENKH
jgi:glycosyltransferase involved in cell wall biosynthesis